VQAVGEHEAASASILMISIDFRTWRSERRRASVLCRWACFPWHRQCQSLDLLAQQGDGAHGPVMARLRPCHISFFSMPSAGLMRCRRYQTYALAYQPEHRAFPAHLRLVSHYDQAGLLVGSLGHAPERAHLHFFDLVGPSIRIEPKLSTSLARSAAWWASSDTGFVHQLTGKVLGVADGASLLQCVAVVCLVGAGAADHGDLFHTQVFYARCGTCPDRSATTAPSTMERTASSAPVERFGQNKCAAFDHLDSKRTVGPGGLRNSTELKLWPCRAITSNLAASGPAADASRIGLHAPSVISPLVIRFFATAFSRAASCALDSLL